MKKIALDAFDEQPQFHAQNLLAEMAQLQEQRRQESPHVQMQSFPWPFARPSDSPYILSLVCSSRGWICNQVLKNTHRHLNDIDNSQLLIEYARAHEWLDGIEDAESKLQVLLEWTKTISSNTFDLVHLTYIAGYTPTVAFPRL